MLQTTRPAAPGPGDVVRVVVADDSQVMRDAVAEVLADCPRLEVVALLADGTDLASTVRRTAADIVLVDVGMRSGGAAATRDVIDTADAVVAAVSASSDLTTVLELLGAGARGYFVKGCLGDGFAEDVLRCARGEVVVQVPHGASIRRLVMSRGPGAGAGTAQPVT